MIAWLLTELEKSPTSLFRERTLREKSKDQFEKLKRQRLLVYARTDDDIETYPCNLPCSRTCPMEVVEMDNQLWAICPEDAEIDPIPLTEDDISRYKFSIDKLIEKVRQDNNFTGSTHRIPPHLHFIGERVINEQNTAFIFACFQNIRTAEPHLLALPARLPAQYNQIVVVTPSLDLSRDPIYLKLRAAAIFPVTLPATFGKKNFKISYLVALSRRPPAGIPLPTPDLTLAQLTDYEEYDYQCQDRLHIPGTIPRKRSNSIIVNSDKLDLGDSPFALLLRFVVELKKGKGGWVNTSDLFGEGLISDPMRYQRYGHIRERVEGSLKGKDGEKFIEADRSGRFRLSTHPDFVTYDKKKLKTHPDPRIIKLFRH